MIEIVKSKIWNLIKTKSDSLLMIYDNTGKILWHKGRAISGKTISSGKGFCKPYTHSSLQTREPMEQEHVDITPISQFNKSHYHSSASTVKKLVIQPINSRYYLYIDSGPHQTFNRLELIELKVEAEILTDMIRQIRKNGNDIGGIVGKSTAMNQVKELAIDYSMEEEPILLLGETGVGKNHLAEFIHRESGRKGNFVVVCAPNLQENLFESILFGHKKGAFTGAGVDRMGLVEEAKGGTLFIDEISEVPLSLQAKLLRFLDRKTFRVLGDCVEKEADVRIIAASNKNLIKAIGNKEFREDLYYRLNVLEITIPPLRERREDIWDFAREKIKYLKGKEVGNGFRQVLCNHDWPGNFRELGTLLKRIGICCKSPITGKDVQNMLNRGSFNKSSQRMNNKIGVLWDQMESGENFWKVVKKPFLERELNRSEVKKIINQGLIRSYGKFKNLVKLFNLKDNEYHKFMTFLRDYKLR